ncbi:MAG TPA: hypothetical protein VF041_13540 [Gemmatimonadaceae bacterium]
MPGAEDPRDFPFHLLDKAGQLHERGFHEAAIVTAQSACELACERAIERSLDRRGASYLHHCLHDLLPSFNLASHRTRDVYTTLAGDHIERESYWCDYTRLAKLRHAIVHGGASVGAETTARCLIVARVVIEHLERGGAAVLADRPVAIPDGRAPVTTTPGSSAVSSAPAHS